MKWMLFTLVMMTAAFSAWLASAQQATEEGHSYWMKKKLEFAETYLGRPGDRGLRKDLEKREQHEEPQPDRGMGAPQRRRRIPHTTAYLSLANREIVRQAENKNIDGVALAYSQLTLSCVNCHKLLRDSKE